MQSRSESELIDLFHRWYEAPYAKLKELPKGDGGFVAMIIGLLLYERYVGAVRHVGHRKTIPAGEIAKELAKDLFAETGCSITEKTALEFWKVYRVGLLHRGFPKHDDALPRWHFTHELSQPIEHNMRDGIEFIDAEPWRFTDFVFTLWRKHPELLDAAVDYPLPHIVAKFAE